MPVQRQIADTLAGGGEHGVAQRRGERRRARFAHPAERRVAGDQMDIDPKFRSDPDTVTRDRPKYSGQGRGAGTLIPRVMVVEQTPGRSAPPPANRRHAASGSGRRFAPRGGR